MKTNEKCEKRFTNEEKNIIINKDYKTLIKDYDKSYKKGGLYMKETKDVVLKEILKGLNLEERNFVKKHKGICKKIYRKGMINSFNFQNKDGTF